MENPPRRTRYRQASEGLIDLLDQVEHVAANWVKAHRMESHAGQYLQGIAVGQYSPNRANGSCGSVADSRVETLEVSDVANFRHTLTGRLTAMSAVPAHVRQLLATLQASAPWGS